MGFGVLGIIAVVCAVACAVGFYKYVYFISIGYGFAMAAGAIAIGVIYRASLTPLAVLQLLLFVAYGARLSGYLLKREIKSAQYRKTLSAVAIDETTRPFPVKVLIWLACVALYVCLLSPVLYRLMNGCADVAVPAIGVAISCCGLALEAASDVQKSAQKAVRPKMVACEGLYRLVRCPNYLGEVIFWTGVLVAGATALVGWQWLLELVAYASIVYIMVSGAARLERRQFKTYGNDPEYRAYADSTPIIFPFVPLYHLDRAAREAAAGKRGAR